MHGIHASVSKIKIYFLPPAARAEPQWIYGPRGQRGLFIKSVRSKWTRSIHSALRVIRLCSFRVFGGKKKKKIDGQS